MVSNKLRAACLLNVLCCAWVTCTLAAEGEDASASIQREDAAAYRRQHYYDPNPCLSDLPEHYTASLAGVDSSYCSQHHHKHHKHNKREYKYYNDDEEDWKKDQCPEGPQDATYINLLRSNDTVGTGVWGMQLDKTSLETWRLLPNTTTAYAAAPANAGGWSLPTGSGYGKYKSYSVNPDIPTLHKRGDKVYLINHFEANQPASYYKTTLKQNKFTGQLTPINTENINAAKDGGLWFTCSGTITPWDSHMGSEEYPADCRIYEATLQNTASCNSANAFSAPNGTACGWIPQASFDAKSSMSMGRFFGQDVHPVSDSDVVPKDGAAAVTNFDKNLGFGNQAILDKFRDNYNCYNYGSSPEVLIGAHGKTHLTKWRTLGRIAHESALVMPDLKTIYTTDDGTNCGFFMFKADRKADLSCGTLYAAKLTAVGTPTDSSASFTVEWIELGYATQKELETLIKKTKPKFSDIFETALPDAIVTGQCPPGFSRVNTPNSIYVVNNVYIECLKVKPGMEKAAVFLETRRYAAMLGATTEFEKEEGITYDPDRNRLYVAYTSINNGMTNDPKYSYGGPGHIAMPKNTCGAVFQYSVDDSTYTAKSASAILYGTPLAGQDSNNNTCNADGISSPDNVHYFNDILFIAEDTDGHKNNLLWAYDLVTKSLTRILSAPIYAEVSGQYMTYINDFAYLTVAMQHPEDDPESTIPLDLATAKRFRGYVGVIGPLNGPCLRKGARPVFKGIPTIARDDPKRFEVVSTTSVTYVQG